MCSTGTSPVRDLVELVDINGIPVGVAGKLQAHRHPGTLHRAFSVFLFNEDGQLLLQRRAAEKYHSPGVWTNSCCGHPRPGESPHAAAGRRVAEELGIGPAALTEVGTTSYCLRDPISGLVESEFNHTFTGRIRGLPNPAPTEVAETRFVTARELREMQSHEQFSVWFATVAKLIPGDWAGQHAPRDVAPADEGSAEPDRKGYQGRVGV